MVTTTIYPTGSGDLTEFSTQSPASGYHYDKVDDVSNDGMATYIRYIGSGSPTDLFTTSPTVSSGKISSVKVSIDVTSRVIYSTCWGVLKTGGTVYPHSSSQVIHYDAYDGFDYIPLVYEWTLNPSTSSQWNWSEIYALQFGVKVHPYNNSQPVTVTKVTLTVTYTVENTRSGAIGFI